MSEAARSAQLRRWLFIIVASLAVVGLLVFLLNYWLVGQFFVTTDDAYIAADSSMIAAKIDGYVTQVAVRDNQAVRAGQLLAVIDPRDYQTSLAAASADTQAAQAALQSDQAQLGLQQTKIDAARAQLQGDAARLSFAEQTQRRYARLSASGASPVQTTDQATTDLATARATLASDQADLLGATKQVSVLQAAVAQALAAQAQAQARAAQAALDLGHAQIRAPFNGIVGDKSVAVGDYLQTGTQIMAIVPVAEVYVIANFKETQLTHLQPGQSVTLHVDAFPDLTVRGTVDSIFPASGQEFALLPPDNATGNFTKIVQRVPVKIDLTLTPGLIGRLRPGMSVEPSIDTRPAA